MFSFRKKYQQVIDYTPKKFFELLSKNVEIHNIKMEFHDQYNDEYTVTYSYNDFYLMSITSNGKMWVLSFDKNIPLLNYLIEFNQVTLVDCTKILLEKIADYKEFQLKSKLKELQSDFT